VNLHDAWTALRHGGNLLSPTALDALPEPGAPPWNLADELRAALVALDPEKPAAAALGALLDTVLESACGLRDGWQKGNALGAADAEKLLDGTVLKPRRRWTGPDGEAVGGLFYYFYQGIHLEILPPLIFLGVGALTDFGPLLGNPRVILLGAAAQGGIFFALLGAIVLGFDMNEASAIGIIGGADGPTAIFTCAQLAPDLLGPVALAAYSYMAMVPIIQPPIIRALTSRQERRIRMEPPANVSKQMKIIFPIAGFLLTAFIAPGGLPLLGMLFFGNLLRESMVTDRLAKTAQTAFIDIVTILLGVTVGAKTNAANFLTAQTIFIFILGIVAFAVATATGVLFAKLMNKLSTEQINPMIGAAGVSAVPMAARVVHAEGLKEDPQNYLIMHAMGPNVAGVIGSAVAAGVLLSRLG